MHDIFPTDLRNQVDGNKVEIVGQLTDMTTITTTPFIAKELTETNALFAKVRGYQFTPSQEKLFNLTAVRPQDVRRYFKENPLTPLAAQQPTKSDGTNKAKVPSNFMHYAACSATSEPILRVMFKKLASITFKQQEGTNNRRSDTKKKAFWDMLKERNEDGLTPLMIASLFGIVPVVRASWKNSQNLDLQPSELIEVLYNQKQTPLDLALMQGHLAVAKILLGYGSRASKCRGNRTSSLHKLAAGCLVTDEDGVSVETVLDLLVTCDADPKELDAKSETCLHYCIRFNNYELAKALLKTTKSLVQVGKTPPLTYCCINPVTYGYPTSISLCDFARLFLNNEAEIDATFPPCSYPRYLYYC